MRNAILPALVCAILALVCASLLLSRRHASFILYLPLAWAAGERAVENYRSSKK